MKIRPNRWAAAVAVLTILSGCGKYDRLVPEELLERKNGLLYEKNAAKPFTGIAVNLRPDGGKLAEFGMVNGKRHGAVVAYEKNGDIMFTGAYEDGKLSGEWVFYADRKIFMRQNYRAGKMIRRTEHYPGGELYSEFTLDEPSLRLEGTRLNPEGEILSQFVVDLKNCTGKLLAAGGRS